MSSASDSMIEKLLCCICMDVLNDPVSTPCGHNFCKICLNSYWDNNLYYRCPYCNKTFEQRPELNINIILRDLVDHFKTQVPEVFCDVCEKVKLKAVKSQQNSPSAFHLIPQLVERGKSHMWILVPMGIILLMLFCFSSTDVETVSIQKLSKVVLKWMQEYAVDVTLDPDTAHPELILYDYNKRVRHRNMYMNMYVMHMYELTENPERFDEHFYVLGKQGFSSGRFYYEVQVKNKTAWILGVARESVNRNGEIAPTPDDGFWTVWMRNENHYVVNAGPTVSLSLKVSPQKVGVFVDYEEGLVSFYDVGSRSHIYSFTDQSFNEKLYPVFNPCRNNDGINSAPLIITPVYYCQ
ncbi:E3 ubiquitin-protein ligase TRIM39-like [Misgurnus anguillicaudatus]|uniref:E3 ubiquitin-protein ligase TRIM39-like n=1 Tax=Misgurnus anguillicaudatus TaxID=75329 RepID=UPI003CCF261B